MYGVFLTLMLSFMVSVTPDWIPRQPDWRAGLPVEAWKWVIYVAGETGESPYIIAAVIFEESRGIETSLSYCGEWRINEPDENGNVTLTCVKQLSCSSGKCKQYWKDRLDLGPFALRQPARKRTLPDGATYSIRGWRWISWFGKFTGEQRGPECAISWQCASEVMSQVILHLATTYAPKHCPESKWPDKLGAWIAWYAGMNPRVGCDARERRLDSAFLGIRERLESLVPGNRGYVNQYEEPYVVMNRFNDNGSMDGWYADVRSLQVVAGSEWHEGSVEW